MSDTGSKGFLGAIGGFFKVIGAVVTVLAAFVVIAAFIITNSRAALHVQWDISNAQVVQNVLNENKTDTKPAGIEFVGKVSNRGTSQIRDLVVKTTISYDRPSLSEFIFEKGLEKAVTSIEPQQDEMLNPPPLELFVLFSQQHPLHVRTVMCFHDSIGRPRRVIATGNITFKEQFPSIINDSNADDYTGFWFLTPSGCDADEVGKNQM